MTPDRREMLAELVRRYARAVGAICWARTGDAGETDDLVQETFMRAIRDFGALREQEKFGAWVRGIAENVCHEWVRGRKRAPAGMEDPDAVPGKETEEAFDDGGRVRRALFGLPEIYRETIALFHFDRKTYGEIAALQGVTPAAVNARLTRGRAMLRERLKGVADDVR